MFIHLQCDTFTAFKVIRNSFKEAYKKRFQWKKSVYTLISQTFYSMRMSAVLRLPSERAAHH